MGCDIHCFIEYRTGNSSEWESFGSEICTHRDYSFFGAMAGVRCPEIPHIAPRGVPTDVGLEASRKNWVYIQAKPKETGCTVEEAAQKLREGGMLLWPERPLPGNSVFDLNGHTASWLTPNEYEAALVEYLKSCSFQITKLPPPIAKGAEGDMTEAALASITLDRNVEYRIILEVMRSFEARGYAARVVFWFDS